MAQAKKKTKLQLEVDNRLLKSKLISDRFAKLGEQTIRTIGWISIAYFLKESVVALAGEYTFLDASLKSDLKVNAELTFKGKVLLYIGIFGTILGIGGIVYGKKQNKLREDDVERLSPYQQKYERLVDKNRTSSNLTTLGNTRKEDE